jgi:ribosome-binding factor A
MSIRRERLGSLIQQEVADLLNSEFSDLTQSLVTVTEARVNGDLSIATVFVSIMASTDEEKEVAFRRIEESKSAIRAALADRIRNQIREIPEIRLELDEALERAQRIEELLEQARDERADREDGRREGE